MGRRSRWRRAATQRSFEGDIFAELKQRWAATSQRGCPDCLPLPRAQWDSSAYDVVRQIERLPSLAKDELGVPDACLMFFDQVLAFDHVKKEIHLIVTADLEARRLRARLATAPTRGR